MGFFSSLGSKISGAVHSIGQKAASVVKKGVKFVGDHAKQIGDVAGTISKVAGVIGTGAAAIGLEPIAAVAGGVSAAAKGVQKVAGMADASVKAGQAAAHGVHHAVDAVRAVSRGNFKQALQQGKSAVADAKETRKQIQRARK